MPALDAVLGRIGPFRAALLSAVAGMLALPAAALSATTIGDTSVTPTLGCATSQSLFQDTSTGPSYTVPAGGGVITSWAYRTGSTAPQSVKLKVWRRTAFSNVFTVVGEDSFRTVAADTTAIWKTRIPVQAGDLIGFALASGPLTQCGYAAPAADSMRFTAGDPSPGTNASADPQPNIRLTVAAAVEPDADRDGYGDETQDQCPADASTHGPCPGPPAQQPPVIPGLPPFAGISLASQTLTVKNGKVSVTVSCPGSSQGNCIGTDTLTTAGKAAAPAARKKKATILRLGRGSFSIPAGRTGKFTVKLNKTALKLLASRKRLRAKQTIVAHDSRNTATTSKGRLTLKARRQKH